MPEDTVPDMARDNANRIYTMSKCTLAAIFIAAVAILQPAAGFAGQCIVYQHRDFKGAYWRLNGGGRLLMIPNPNPGYSSTTNGHGPKGVVYYRPDWNDQISSIRVDANCMLSLYEHAHQGGRSMIGKTTYYLGDKWNDIASDAFCNCV